MERIKNLKRHPKRILIILTVMVVWFTVSYCISASQVGYAHLGFIFQPKEENGNTVYTAQIGGKEAKFTVTKDKSVTYQYGKKICGPYTVREDATAIPKDSRFAEDMTGIEIREGEEVFFRGGVQIIDEENLGMIIEDEKGNRVNHFEERKKISVQTILELMEGPRLVSQCEWMAWIGGVLIYIITAVHILFADELLRWFLGFSVQYAYEIEPSDLKIAIRYISWTVLTIVMFNIFVWGLCRPI